MGRFWTDATGRDPKRAYRFQCVLPNLGENGCTWFITSVGKPAVTISESKHTYLNHDFYYPGRVSWNTISVTLVDPVEPDATAIMSSAIEDAGYKVPASFEQASTISKAGATAQLGIVEINQIDADGKAVESWTLHNAWIKSATFGDLDYGSDGLTNVQIEVRYDWAQLDVHGATAGVQDRKANAGIFQQQ